MPLRHTQPEVDRAPHAPGVLAFLKAVPCLKGCTSDGAETGVSQGRHCDLICCGRRRLSSQGCGLRGSVRAFETLELLLALCLLLGPRLPCYVQGGPLQTPPKRP